MSFPCWYIFKSREANIRFRISSFDFHNWMVLTQTSSDTFICPPDWLSRVRNICQENMKLISHRCLGHIYYIFSSSNVESQDCFPDKAVLIDLPMMWTRKISCQTRQLWLRSIDLWLDNSKFSPLSQTFDEHNFAVSYFHVFS